VNSTFKRNNRISSKIEIEYPDVQIFPSLYGRNLNLPTKANFFRIVAHSASTFIPISDLTNAVFKNLTLSDYDKEIFVLLVAADEGAAYEWEQHVSIAQAAGVRQDRFMLSLRIAS
jgi:hypothetical protein